MALSLSGDDEEYDSESEQVRAAAFNYVTSVYARVCFYQMCCDEITPFVSGIVFFVASG